MLEPDDGFDVEVVRWLVHQQYIRHSEQHARQSYAHLPSAGESANVAVNLIVLESQAMEHFTGLRFERVTAQVLVLLLHMTEALENALHLIRFAWIGHFVLQSFELVVEITDATAAGDRFIQDRTALHLLDILA